MPDADPAASSRSRRGCGCGCGSLVLGCLGVIVLVVVGVAAVGLFAWWQWTSSPDYWQTQQARMQQLTDTEREALAQRAEHRFSGWLTDAEHADPAVNYAASAEATAAGEGERSLSLSFDEINAYLDRRLEGLMAQPEIDFDLPVRQVIVTSQDGKLIVAGDVNLPRFQQVVSAVVDATMLPDGNMHVHVQSVRVGRFPVPTDMVVRFAREHLPRDERTEGVERVLHVFEGTTFDPVYKRDEPHELRLTNWTIDDDGIDLTVINTPPRDGDQP